MEGSVEDNIPHILNDQATECRQDCDACRWAETEGDLLRIVWRAKHIAELYRLYALEDNRGN